MKQGGPAAALIVTVVAAVLASSVAFALEVGRSPGSEPSPLLDEPLPSVEVLRLDGTGIVSTDTIAGDIALIHFWSPACAACAGERAALLDLAAAYADFGVAVVTVLVQGSPAAGRSFLGEHGRSPLVTDAFDSDATASLAFGIGPVPVTFVVDRTGVVVGKVTGAAGHDLLEAAIDAVIVGD